MVEDDNAISDVLSIILKSNLYNVITYTSAEDCLSTQEEVPDVFLIDYHLPGMNGLELCTKLKSNTATKHIPVIMISADYYIRKRASECGASTAIDKPFSRLELLEAIQDALHTDRS